MASLIVGGLPIRIAGPGVKRDRLDAVDRRRAFDLTYRASATGNPKNDFHFTSAPVLRSVADTYERVLSIITAQVCSGDIIGGSENLVLQSENFGSTWVAEGTPTRSPVDTVVGGITLDKIGDDSAAAIEGYKQTIGFTNNATKAISAHVKQITSASSVIRLEDTNASADRLFGALTWSGGLPVLVMSTGTYLGYDALGPSVFRLKFTTSSVTAGNTNVLHIYPATTNALLVANIGELDVGGIQAENGSVPSSYIKTTTAAGNTLSGNYCAEITGITPSPSQGGHVVVFDFVLHEV